MKSMLDYIILEKEICTQVIHNFNNQKEILDKIKKKEFKRVVIYATGSSSNAVNSARLYMASLLNMPVEVQDPSIAYAYDLHLNTDTLYIAISQGGHSYSIIKLMQTVQNKGFDIFALTSDLSSPLAIEAQYCLDLNMGIEEMPFVTAGYTSTIIYLWLLAIELSAHRDIISREDAKEKIKDIQSLVNSFPYVINKSYDWIEENFESFKKLKRFVFIAYGAAYGVAKEADTKFTETIRKTSFSNELEEYMHGPYIGLHEEDGVFLISSNGILEERQKLLRVFLDKHINKTYYIAIGNDGQNESDLNLGLKCNELLAPIILTIPIHILAYKLSQYHKIDLSISSYPDFDEITKSKI